MALFTNKKSQSTPETSKTALEFIRPILEGLTDWSETTLHDVVMEAIPASGMKNATVLWPLRIAVTGRAATPGGAFEMLYLLGKDESMKRLDAAMADVIFFKGLIAELHVHLARAALVQLIGYHGDEFGLIQTGVQDDVLTLLGIDAHAGDQLSVFAQSCFLHETFLLLFCE